jgi:RND family efflux transporter MFP subunit
VTRGSVSRSFPALAELQAASKIRVAPQVSGTLLTLPFHEGHEVKAGELMATIDGASLRARKEQIKATLLGVEAEVQRHKDELVRETALAESGGSAISAVEEHRTAVVTAKARAQALRKQMEAVDIQLGYLRVKAPMDGFISARLAEPGDLAAPGKPLYHLINQKQTHVVVRVPLETLLESHIGTQVVLRHGKQTQVVRIARIDPAMDRQALGRLEADEERPPLGLPFGARLSAGVILEQLNKTLIIPRRALLPSPEPHVFLVVGERQGHLRKVPVKVLLEGPEGIAVEGNFKEGDRVALAHSSQLLRLHDNDPAIFFGPEVR